MAASFAMRSVGVVSFPSKSSVVSFFSVVLCLCFLCFFSLCKQIIDSSPEKNIYQTQKREINLNKYVVNLIKNLNKNNVVVNISEKVR